MKQSFITLAAAFLGLAAFTSCSKHTGQAITSNTAAPKKGLELKQGQKLQLEYTTKAENSMEMMGQQMEITADALITRQLEVTENRDTSYKLSSTITRMKVNSSVMGQSLSYDSDKPEDGNNEMGKMLSEQLNVAREVEVNNNGKPVGAGTPGEAAASGNPMMSLIENMGATADESYGANEAFQVLPPNLKAGDTWMDSSIIEGSKTYRTYTLASVTGNIALITYTGTQEVKKSVEAQGMGGDISMDSKLSGEITLDTATGIVQQRTLTMEGSGTVEAMGQAIPMNSKVTTTSVIKKL